MIINCTWFAVKESKCWCAKDTGVIMASVNEGLGDLVMDCGEDNSSLTHFLLSALLWHPTVDNTADFLAYVRPQNFGGLLIGELLHTVRRGVLGCKHILT